MSVLDWLHYVIISLEFPFIYSVPISKVVTNIEKEPPFFLQLIAGFVLSAVAVEITLWI